MDGSPQRPSESPADQQAIRATCFHPSGLFVAFDEEEIQQSIPARFEKIVRRYPERVAVKAQHEELTYADLNRAANRVAHAILARRQVGPEPVAVLLPKGVSLVVAVLGVLKAGEIFVLLDPTLPNARLRYTLDDMQAGLIVTTGEHSRLAEALAEGTPWLDIGTVDPDLSTENPGVPIAPHAYAYVLYTSGSTGRPKGIVETHRNLLHYIMTETNDLHICAEDRLTFLASQGRDIFRAVLNGAAVYPMEIKQDGLAGLACRLMREEITIYNSVASAFRQFVNTLDGAEEFPHLRLVKLMGETVYRRDVELCQKHFSERCIFVNWYGPNETGLVSHYLVDRATRIASSVVPIGYAVRDKEVLILGEDDEPVGFDETGEIAVRSRYLSPGYWGSAESSQEAKRVYRTGDLGSMRPEGCLRHLGRKDSQVKIRGSRVEIPEVEMALLDLDGIREAVVEAREDVPGDKRLVAYIVPASMPAPTVSTLRNALAATLPDYMIPSGFVMMDALPLIGIGKVDRRALPAPDHTRPELERAFVAPRDGLELQLRRIWEEVLEVRTIGIQDNFFDLGGHSLLAVQLFAQIEKVLGRSLPLVTLVQAPTVEQLADILRQNEWVAPWSSLVALQPQGTKPPFFCLHTVGGGLMRYYALARRLAPDQPVYGLQARGLDGVHAPHTRLEDMAAHYIAAIRTVQPEGPYALGGLSLGGKIAFEMARQLHAQGQTVALLALFDTHGPGYPRLSPTAARLGYKVYATVYRLAQRIDFHLENLRLLESHERRSYMAARGRNAIGRLTGRVKRERREGSVVPLSPVLRGVEDAIQQAGRKYVPGVYAGRVTMFRASKRPPEWGDDPRLGWGELAAGGVASYEIPGWHTFGLEEPGVRVLAKQLRICLDAAQRLGPQRQRVGEVP